MLFQHINRHADKHRKRVYLVLVAVIGLSFVVFVTPRGCNNMGGQDGRKIGTVYGKKVTLGQFRRIAKDVSATVYLTGRRPDMTDRKAHIQVLGRMQLLHEARRLGLEPVSPEQFEKYVKDHPAFKKDGKFSKEVLDNVRNYVTSQLRMTGADFDRVLRENIAIERVYDRVANGIVASPVEVRDSFLADKELFGLSYAQFKLDPKADGDPADAELQAYFDANRDALHLPDLRVVRVISLPFPKADSIDKKTITEDRLKKRYETLKKSPRYKDKTFDQVRAELLEQLLKDEPRVLAEAKAKALLAELAKRPADETLEALAERAAKLAAEAGATFKDSKPFATDAKTLPDFPKLRALLGTSRSLTEDKPIASRPFTGGNAYHIVMFLKTVPGDKAEKLEQVRDDVVKAVLAQQAVALFREKALPHAEELKGLAKLNPATFADEQLGKSKDATTDEQRQTVREEAYTLAMRYLAPAFKPEQRTAWVAEFKAGTFQAEAHGLITEDLVRAYFDKETAEYKEQKQQRVSQIVVRLPYNADDKAKEAARKRADAILERLRAGEKFEEVATKESDDPTKTKGGDLGFIKVGSNYDLKKPLEGLKVGEMTDVIETQRSLIIAKLTDERDGVPYGEAKSPIRRKLVDEKAAALAKERATKLADAVIEAFEKGRSQLAEDIPDSESFALARRVFEQIAADQGVTITKIDEPFGASGHNPAVQYQVVQSVHKLSPQIPFSDPLASGRDQSVAMLDGIVPGRLYDLQTERDTIEEKFSEVVRKDNARAKAKAKAEALREAYAAAKDDKEPEGVQTKLTPFEPFTRADVSLLDSTRRDQEWYTAYMRFRDLPAPQAIKAIDKAQAGPGTVLELIENEESYTVIRVDSRTLPPDEDFNDDAKKRYAFGIRQAKTAAAYGALGKRLASESNATLFGENYSALMQ